MRSRSNSESSQGGTAEGWGPSAPGHPVINLYLSTFSGHTSTTKGALQGRRRTTWSTKQAHLVQSCSAPFHCRWNCTKLKLEKIENTQKRKPPAKKKKKKKETYAYCKNCRGNTLLHLQVTISTQIAIWSGVACVGVQDRNEIF